MTYTDENGRLHVASMKDDPVYARLRLAVSVGPTAWFVLLMRLPLMLSVLQVGLLRYENRAAETLW